MLRLTPRSGTAPRSGQPRAANGPAQRTAQRSRRSPAQPKEPRAADGSPLGHVLGTPLSKLIGGLAPMRGSTKCLFLRQTSPFSRFWRSFQNRQVSEMVISRHRRAQGLVEFGLLLALVAVVALAGLVLFGGAVNQLMSTTSRSVALNV